MGAWTDYASEDLDEGVGNEGQGDGTSEITLNPGEKAHVFVTRTDGASNGDDWLIAIQGSIEDTPDYADDPPLRSFRMEDSQTERDFIVAGLYAFRIWVEGDGDDLDQVTATVGWRKDGVSI